MTQPMSAQPFADLHEPALPIVGQPLTPEVRETLQAIISRDGYATPHEAIDSCLTVFGIIVKQTGNRNSVHVCHGRQIIREYAFRYPSREEYATAAPQDGVHVLSLFGMQCVYAALRLGINMHDLFNVAILTFFDLSPLNGLIIMAPQKRRFGREYASPSTIVGYPIRAQRIAPG